MNSSLYIGTIRHRRYRPTVNQFQYRLFMVLADLDELPAIFHRHPLWSMEKSNVISFKRSDYLGPPDIPLDSAVRDLVHRRTGHRPGGPIRLLTHFRTWGYVFNPVSFYYCYDESGNAVQTVVTHIRNTPWGEGHTYVLSKKDRVQATTQWQHYKLKKAFHISPFMDMDLNYDWRFKQPGKDIKTHMRLLLDGRLLFDASLRLQQRPLEKPAMTRVLYQYPFMTHKVTMMIYWQALRLWHKHTPFYPHPAKRSAS